jgi:hypothetical protein
MKQSIYRAELFNLIAQEYCLELDDVAKIYECVSITDASDEELFMLINELLISSSDESFDPESLPAIMSASIYNLDTEDDIQKFQEISMMKLNEGSADVEDLDRLHRQAISYFKMPKTYPLAEDDVSDQVLKCYVEFFSHAHFNEVGELVDVYRSSGIVFNCSLEHIEDEEWLIDTIQNMGLCFDKSMRIKVYGLALYDLVGAKAYHTGEKAEFVSPFKDMPNLLFAIPDTEAVLNASGDDFKILEKLVSDEVQYGRSVNEVLGNAMTSWILAHEFFDERYPYMLFEEQELEFELKLKRISDSHKAFKDNFSEEISHIHGLNSKSVSLAEIASLDAHLINRILYVCKSDQFKERLLNKNVYMQLLAMSRKKNHSYKIAA